MGFTGAVALHLWWRLRQPGLAEDELDGLPELSELQQWKEREEGIGELLHERS